MAEFIPKIGQIYSRDSLKVMAFNLIKTAIITNKLKSGKCYSVPTLAKTLGVSRSPVREALLELSAKGFVEFLPRRGVRIKELSKTDIINLIYYRKALEKSVAEHIDRIGMTTELWSNLTENLEKMSSLSKTGDTKTIMNMDREFHQMLAEHTRNPFLVKALEDVRDLADWSNYSLMEEFDRTPEIIKEHFAIIDHLKKEDLQGAFEKIDHHLDTGLDRMLKYLF